jgi:uncharacterized Zn finger protein
VSRYSRRFSSYGGWAPYVPVEKRRRNAAREAEALRKSGQTMTPVTIAGRTIATTFWGKAWCGNMESYQDYQNRLPRGRTYVRNGSVIDLQITPGRVSAVVSGSEIYHVSVSINEVPAVKWQAICADCAGGIDSLVELLQGRFSKGVMERLCRQEGGLFPRPSEIRFSCSCPDHAGMCKHIAAVLYGVGARLDHAPELLFRLRAVSEADLVAHVDAALPMAKSEPSNGRVLEGDDLSALFGLDMAQGAPAAPAAKRVRPKKRVASNPAAPAKPAGPKTTPKAKKTAAPKAAAPKAAAPKAAAPKAAATKAAATKAAATKAAATKAAATKAASAKQVAAAPAKAGRRQAAKTAPVKPVAAKRPSPKAARKTLPRQANP